MSLNRTDIQGNKACCVNCKYEKCQEIIEVVQAEGYPSVAWHYVCERWEDWYEEPRKELPKWLMCLPKL